MCHYKITSKVNYDQLYSISGNRVSDTDKKIPPNWEKSKKTIRASQRASQVTFELSNDTPDFIRIIAAKNSVSPSDQIRMIIGLAVKAPKRPRMSISLSKEDYQHLGQRYNISPNNKEIIHLKIKSEIELYHQHQKDDE